MITILCPSRGRPREFKRMVESAIQTAHDPDNLRFMLFLGTDDPSLGTYSRDLKNVTIFVGQPWSAVMASNYLYTKAKELLPQTRLFMVGADDMVFSTPLWDKALMDEYDKCDSKIHVYCLRDSRDVNGTPHPIVTAGFANALGYFLPPIFLHWFVDSWVVDIAKANGCFTHLKDYLLIHDKPSDRGIKDETHNRIRAMGWHERDAYVNQACLHFLGTEKDRLRTILQMQSGTEEHAD